MGKIVLTCSDGERFEVDRDVIEPMSNINSMIEDLGDQDGDDRPIPLTRVAGPVFHFILAYAIEYQKMKDKMTEEAANNGEEGTTTPKQKATDPFPWEMKHLTIHEKPALFDIILAANFLNFKPLLDATTKHVANMIRGKTPDQIREEFNVQKPKSPSVKEEDGEALQTGSTEVPTKTAS